MLPAFFLRPRIDARACTGGFMKFSNGCWLTREGVQVFSPAEVYSRKASDFSVQLYCPCSPIKTRGDTLKGPVVTIEFSAPAKDCLRVRSYHNKETAAIGPSFDLAEKRLPVSFAEDDDYITIGNGALVAKVAKKTWKISYYFGGAYLTSSGFRALSYIEVDEAHHEEIAVPTGFRAFGEIPRAERTPYFKDQLSLSVGEMVYGLGERFTPFIKNGQVVDMWNEDGGTSTNQSYKNIPFYVTNKNYGVFVNHPEKVSFEVGSEKVNAVQFSVKGESLDCVIVGGGSMKAVLSNYTAISGKPALPPSWSFGLWLSTSFTTNYDEKTVTEFVDGFASRGLPLQVFHFDCFWMKGFNWCDFTWDPEVFPDPRGMLQRLKAKGLKICVWINPYVSQASSLFDEGAKNGYFIRKRDPLTGAAGGVWQCDHWQPSMAIVDFTNPAACDWFTSKLGVLVDMGVDALKTDFGERIPVDVVYHDGSDPLKMHNYYTYLYNKTVFEFLESKKGKENAVLFARSAAAGGQKFPVHWGGDCSADFESMQESLRGGLSLCMSGFGFWSHDIGGFESNSSADVYNRWVAFGLLSSHSRLHGSWAYRVPWAYGEESCDVVRYFGKLKNSIMPYLFAQAVETSKTGVPLMRAMVLEFTNDPAAVYLDKQYLLGPNLLVAPVLSASGDVTYYLPEGTWTNYLTGKTVEGGRYVTEHHGFLSIPLFARENSIVARNEASSDDGMRTVYDYADGVTLDAFELGDGKSAECSVYGTTSDKLELAVKISRNGNGIVADFAVLSKPVAIRAHHAGSVTEFRIDAKSAKPGRFEFSISR
jgi:alpha-D-xyloside xylohydrolase